jgi:hypothetical protein
MLRLLRNIVLGLFLFATVPSILTGCEESEAQVTEKINPEEIVLITKPGTYKGDTSISLYMSPCDNKKVIAFLDSDFVKEAFSAKGHFEGKDYAGCYLVDFEEGIVYFMDEEGRGGRISIESFQVAPKI